MRSLRLRPQTLGILLALPCALPASARATVPQAVGETTTLVGRVDDPLGAPVTGAVVITSAGGRAVTAADGTYRVELQLDAGAALDVAAFAGSGSGSTQATTHLGSLALGRANQVPALALTNSGDCGPTWLEEPDVGPDLLGAIYSLAVFDPAGPEGPYLIAGGSLALAGNPSDGAIARWTSAGWVPIHGPLGPGEIIYDMVVFDDGSGPGLVVVGDFAGPDHKRVAQWNGGSDWEFFGQGFNAAAYAVAIFDDGAGPAIHVGGNFLRSGSASVAHLARWDGAAWVEVGGGMSHQVRVLAVHDDGSGPALFAGGSFATAGGVSARRIARWDGASWSPLGEGLFTQGSSSSVFGLASAGDPLYVGGRFETAGGLPANNLAAWDGATWSSLPGGVAGFVRALAVYDDGTGPGLYLGGRLDFAWGPAGLSTSPHVMKWTGVWSPASSGASSPVRSFSVFDDGRGSALYATGTFFHVLGVSSPGLGRWNGSEWCPVGPGTGYSKTYALASAQITPDGGPTLYVGGESFLRATLGACESVTFYCEPKPSSINCVTRIGTSDPSQHPVSGANDYAVTATQVQGLKNGHVFVGISGPAAIPFLGGTLCITPPTKRGATMNSGTNSSLSCAGSYLQIVNSGLTIPLGLDAGAGNSAWYQWWYRDLQNGEGNLGSAFSDAVRLDFL